MKNISTLILEVLSTLTEILTKVLYPYIYQSIIYYFAEPISPFITPVNWLSIVSLIRPNIRNVSISEVLTDFMTQIHRGSDFRKNVQRLSGIFSAKN